MNTYFDCTVKYIKMDEKGRERKATETYMIDAVSCTEAESRIYKELEKMISGEFRVPKIIQSRVSEIIPSDSGDRWYKAKVSFITVDEQSGKEKPVTQQVLVFANEPKEACDNIIEAMQGLMADFEIISISESKILDVFPYVESEKVIPTHLKPIESFLTESKSLAESDKDIKTVLTVEDGEEIEVYQNGDGSWTEKGGEERNYHEDALVFNY